MNEAIVTVPVQFGSSSRESAHSLEPLTPVENVLGQKRGQILAILANFQFLSLGET